MPAEDQDSPAIRAVGVLSDPTEGSLLITGAPGLGKTHALHEVAARSPLPTVWVSGNPVESALPLSGLGAVLAAVDARAADFAGRFVLRSTDRHAVPAAAADILSLVRGLRLPATAVLIDDIDTMDASSQALLGFMAGRLGGSELRFVATATWVGGRGPLAGFPRARLSPLSASTALELLAAVGPRDLHEGTARILVAQSAGNPATLLARARTLRAAQRAGRRSLQYPLPVRRPGRRIARHALDRLDLRAREVVRVLALAPLLPPAALADAGLATRDELDDLVVAGVAEDVDTYVRLRNPILRAAVFATLSAGERRALHAALADAAEAHAPGLARWHASHADAEHRPTDGVLRAALELIGEGLVPAAVELADDALRAVERTPDPAEAIELVQRLLRRGEWALAERYLVMLDQREFPQHDRAMIVLARLRAELERTGRLPHAELLTALERYGPVEPTHAVALAATTALGCCFRGELPAAQDAVDLVAPLRSACGDDAVRQLDAVVELIDTMGGGALAHGLPAREVVDEGATLAELIARARSQSLREEYRAAARTFALAIDLGDVEGADHPPWRELALLMHADNSVRAGWVEEALTAVARVRGLRLPPHLEPIRVLLVAWSDVTAGHADAAEERLREWAAEPHGSEGLAGAAVYAMLGGLALVRGDAATAARDLSHADLLVGDLDPGIVRHHPLLVDALLEAGRIDAARAALERFEAAVRRFPRRWAVVALAGARAALADGDPSGRAFDQALGTLTPDDPPLERARLLLRKGLRLRRHGAPEAEGVLLEARAAFEALGAGAWYPADATRIAGDPDAEERPGLGMLTEPEREVARLVLLGFQNKEIAAQLFVSLRTVELRLTHIYRKTGTHSRSQLVAALL